MHGFKPNEKLWRRVNKVIRGENAAEAIVTVTSGICQLLIHGGIAEDEDSARVQLAAMILSPDDGRPAGSLIARLQAEAARIGADNTWRH